MGDLNLSIDFPCLGLRMVKRRFRFSFFMISRICGKRKPPLGQIQEFLENFLQNLRVIVNESTQYVDFKRL